MKRFIKSAVLISIGGALPLLSGLVLLIPYTDKLQISLFGELEIYISFSLLVQYIMNYGIDTYLSVHYYDYKDDPPALKKFLSSVSGLLLLIGIILIAFFSLSGYFIFRIVFPNGIITFFPFGLMSVITAFFNAFFRTYVNLQVFGDKPLKYFLFGLFNFVVTVLISVILVYQYPQSLIGPMWGRLLSGVLIFLLTIIYVQRDFGIGFDKKLLPGIRSYCTPMLLFNVLTWVLAYINNYILNACTNTADVGTYGFAVRTTMLIEYAGIGLLSTINPRIYQIYKKNGTAASSVEENRYHHVFSSFSIVFIAFNILILPIVIRLVVHNEQYYASIALIPVLCSSFVFRGLYNAFSNPLFFYKNTKVLPRILFISAIIQIAAGIILVKSFGIWGAAWSYFLIRPVQVFLLWLESRKVFDFKFNMMKMLVVPAVYAGAVIGISQINSFSEIEQAIMQMALAILLVASMYTKEIRAIPELLRKI